MSRDFYMILLFIAAPFMIGAIITVSYRTMAQQPTPPAPTPPAPMQSAPMQSAPKPSAPMPSAPMTPAPNSADDTSVTRGTTADPAAPAGKEQPILAYFLALAGVGGTLLIVCAPARKK